MNDSFRVAPRAMRERARDIRRKPENSVDVTGPRRHKAGRLSAFTAMVAGALMMSNVAVEAGVKMPDGTALKQFGFAAGGRAISRADNERHLDIGRQIFGEGGLYRVGLAWDPVNQDVPGFETWIYEVLEPALARGQIVVPTVRTIRLGSGQLRLPTDAQWAHGLREVVRVLGPGGVYQTGGSYVIRGRTVRVSAHPEFAGLTDFEIWNEPESKGNAGGAMTPGKMANLIKIAAEVMRDQAAKQGFAINLMGPGISGFHTAYLQQMKEADPSVFSYFDTLTIHAYTRNGVNQCKVGTLRCVRTLDNIRTYLNTNGGTHIHMGITEAGVAGDRAQCTGPQVRTEEQQRDYSTENFNWIRERPHLNLDFWITTFPYDRPATYSYPCTAKTVDPYYWESKLGVVRADGTLKPWGVQWKALVEQWKAQ